MHVCQAEVLKSFSPKKLTVCSEVVHCGASFTAVTKQTRLQLKMCGCAVSARDVLKECELSEARYQEDLHLHQHRDSAACRAAMRVGLS